MCKTELDSKNILRWLVIHNMRKHPHYHPPGRPFIVSAQEVFLRERAFYLMLYDVIRYALFIALVLTMINTRRDYDVFLRNDSVYRQIFNDPQYKHVRIHVLVIYCYSSIRYAILIRNTLFIFRIAY